MLKPVPIAQSSHLEAVSYDDEAGTLYCQFAKSGKVYAYLKVPENIVTDLSNALSTGKFFDEMINGSYEFQKVQ